ncbi:chalcone--flavanone isomerase 1A-like [Prosopis cineraria]|uniref:chalcone--flavanone isomerase 1A-like n=1 Tax=Prosopis cineraria TaxID=364024 RepID=UPI0024105999|nr:chalcone--flavanone isomerase 1A-like [Prosopis cineraria]
MATVPASLTGVTVEFLEYPATVTAPASSGKTYYLGGAGVRGVTIEGQFTKVTTIGVYLEDKAFSSVASKWKGKTPDELVNSIDFFMDIIKGPYEKLIRGSKIVALEGAEYGGKVSQNCANHMKAAGTYGEAEAKAIDKFVQIFQPYNFSPGSSVFYLQSPDGTLTISFSDDTTLPENPAGAIENKALSETLLETMIGEHAVSPALKQSLASRLSSLFKDIDVNNKY